MELLKDFTVDFVQLFAHCLEVLYLKYGVKATMQEWLIFNIRLNYQVSYQGKFFLNS